MKVKKAQLLGLALAMMEASCNPSLYAVPEADNSKPYPRPKDLPAWKVGEHIIHAKDEKTAIKYAKKRGLWKDGIVITKV